MTISALRITNFRNLACAELLPHPQGFNILHGANGSGKTSLLEAIYFLSMGRSFRTATAGRLIRQDHREFSLYSQILNETGHSVALGIEKSATGAGRLRMAERDVSGMAELTACLPVRLINSQSHQLFESGPAHRRKYLDWGLFYQSSNFLTNWRQFERVLKQRNSVLRQRGSRNEVAAWSDAFIQHAHVLDQLRRDYVRQLVPLLHEQAQSLLDTLPGDLSFGYHPGWDEQEELATVLADAYHDEIRLGHTLYGPHRADLTINLSGIPVKHFLSRGQQKLLICAMIAAQGMLLEKQENKRVIYLVDDLPAELDSNSRQKLMALLAQQSSQIFVTAIEPAAISDLNQTATMKMFHVKQGALL